MLLVTGKDNTGKSHFAREICQYFYMHNEFLHAILYQNLANIDSEDKFSALIAKLSGIVKSLEASNNDQDNSGNLVTGATQSGDDDRRTLWTFTNVDMLRKRFWNRLESYLFDTYKNMKQKDLRIIMTHNGDYLSSQFRFKNFALVSDDPSSKPAHGPVKTLSREKSVRGPRRETKTSPSFKVRQICLTKLDEADAIEMLVANMERKLCLDDFSSNNS